MKGRPSRTQAGVGGGTGEWFRGSVDDLGMPANGRAEWDGGDINSDINDGE